MKRLVLLGSAVSVLNPFEDTSTEGKVYTEKDWNPVILRTWPYGYREELLDYGV